MKTKTLLIAAAALAAGVISSQAQGVYSQNIVGYVNTSHVAGGFYLEAPTLDLDGTGTNNTISTVYPNPAIGDSVYIFSPSLGGYVNLSYTVVTTGGRTGVSVTNWFNGSGVLSSNYPINVGQGIFYQATANETNTQVGVVFSGSLTNAYFPAAGGINLLGSQVPIAGGLTSVLGYQPNIDDAVYVYTNGAYANYSYTVVTTGGRTGVSVTNWFNGSGVAGEPIINVGQGFWLQPAVNNSWVQVFTNQ